MRATTLRWIDLVYWQTFCNLPEPTCTFRSAPFADQRLCCKIESTWEMASQNYIAAWTRMQEDSPSAMQLQCWCVATLSLEHVREGSQKVPDAETLCSQSLLWL